MPKGKGVEQAGEDVEHELSHDLKVKDVSLKSFRGVILEGEAYVVGRSPVSHEAAVNDGGLRAKGVSTECLK